MPWTSGSLYVTDVTAATVTADVTAKAKGSDRYVTSGGWGNMRIERLGPDGVTVVEGTCTRNGGRPCDPKVLGHAG